ncbi:FUSC family protein [Georgenia sp. MJ170]|uniref:FUSC family protein n=1 Tax=Georgenia sunbinii TaxID=3117728 RepID=UPI002F261BFF
MSHPDEPAAEPPQDPRSNRGSRPLRGVRWYIRPPSRWQVAVRAASAIGVPVIVMTLLGNQPYGLLMGTGAFTVLYGAGRARRTRLRLLSAVAASLVACCALGAAFSGWPLLGLLLIVVVAMVATVACHALRVGPPGAFFFVLLAGLGGYLPHHGVAPATLVSATAIGAAFAVVVAMADVIVRPRGPQEDAVARARAAVARFRGADPTGADAEGLSEAATEALHDGWAALADGGDGASLHPRSVALVTELRAVQRDYSGHLLPGDRSDPELAAESTEAPLGRPSARRMLRHALRWPSNALQAAVRVGVGVTIAGAVAWLIDVDHAYWAMAATMLVLHTGLDRKRTAVRSAHRLVGTVIGLGGFLAVHALTGASEWLIVPVVIALQGLVELFVVRNYAVAVVFITPLALTVGTAGTRLAVTSIATERLVDTVIGVLIGAAVPWFVGRRGAPSLLRACLGRVLAAGAVVVDHLGAGSQAARQGRDARQDLGLAMQEMSAAARRAMQDDPRDVAPLLDLREATAWLGLTVLARSATQTGVASGVEGAAWACRLMARQLHEGRVPPADSVRLTRAAIGDRPRLS